MVEKPDTQINVVRLVDGKAVSKPIDTHLILSIEFVLSNKQIIRVLQDDSGGLCIQSQGRLRIAPDASNSVVIEGVGVGT